MKAASNSVTAFNVAVGTGVERLAEYSLQLSGRAVSALTDYVRHSYEAIDTSAKMADRLHIATGSLQELEFAASRARIGTEDFDHAMSHMVRTIGETSISHEAAEAFARLNIPLRQIQGMHADVAFKTIADAIKNLRSNAEQAALTQAVFGRGGQALSGLLASGSDAISEMGKQARGLGVAMSEISVQQVVLANNQFMLLQKTVAGAANAIAAELAPFLLDATNRVIEFANAHGGLQNMARSAFAAIEHFLASMADGLNLLKSAWYGFQAVVNKVVDWIIVGPLQALSYAVDAMVIDFQNAINNIIDAARYLSRGAIDFHNITVRETGLSNFMDDVHKQLVSNVEESVLASNKALEDFGKGVNGASVQGYFGDVKSLALKTATEMADAKSARDNATQTPGLGIAGGGAAKASQGFLARDIHSQVLQRGGVHDIASQQLSFTKEMVKKLEALISVTKQKQVATIN